MASVEKPPLRKGSPLAPGLARSPPSSYSLLSLPRGLLFSLVPFSLGLDICLCACSVAQSYLTLCDPLDCSTPGFSVHGILQARILAWIAMPSSRGSSRVRDRTCVSCISSVGRQVLYHCATWEAPLPASFPSVYPSFSIGPWWGEQGCSLLIFVS